MDQPTIYSKRLVLRPFDDSDATAVQLLAGAQEIADTTLSIPHPYEDGMAEQWIADHRDQFRAGTGAVFAIAERASDQLIGAIGLTVDTVSKKAELGYWIGLPFWNKGYATEAAGRLIGFGFDELDLNRIAAQHMVRNPASGRVMQKVGMSHEGTIRQGMMKWGKFEDLEMYGILRSEWSSADQDDVPSSP